MLLFLRAPLSKPSSPQSMPQRNPPFILAHADAHFNVPSMSQNRVSTTTNTASSFDKPVSNTSAKSLPTKDKAEEDDSERQPFQDPLDIISISHPLPHVDLMQNEFDNANIEDSTQPRLVAGRIPVEPAASLTKEIGMDAPDDEEDCGFSDTNICLSAPRASAFDLSPKSNTMDRETNSSQ
ncbi:hypothetical protein B0H34DRAFT_801389 [Crassisporium funariophilum]|nr:hypothetical protein B0H34DRAFT_801389 [Crassisporium funariophilum]